MRTSRASSLLVRADEGTASRRLILDLRATGSLTGIKVSNSHLTASNPAGPLAAPGPRSPRAVARRAPAGTPIRSHQPHTAARVSRAVAGAFAAGRLVGGAFSSPQLHQAAYRGVKHVLEVSSQEVALHASTVFRSPKKSFANASELFADLRKGA